MSDTAVMVNPMPTEGSKSGAVAIKAIIGVLALINMVPAVVEREFKKEEAEHKTGLRVIDGLEIAYTLLDSGLSFIVGYLIYAPMDTYNERIKDSEYQKIIKNTSDAAATYSYLWIGKTLLDISKHIVSIVGSCKKVPTGNDESEGLEVFNKLFNIVYPLCYISTCIISTVFEFIALGHAIGVDNNKLTDKQRSDKKCFITETTGFICDDICSILDELISTFKIKNVYMFIAREVFALGYSVTMFVECGLIAGA